jgi:uncharacterized protein YecE (DUF72 family)
MPIGRPSTGRILVVALGGPERPRDGRREPSARESRAYRGPVARIRIGTCSFADEALSKWWYPRGLAPKERLSYYAERFDTVEIDSTYYRLPEQTTISGWERKTPPGFVFHLKAFGMMTRHPVRVEQLPPDLREEAPVDDRGRVERPPRELRAEVFQRFLSALEPLRETGKMGGVLFQLPSYVVRKESSLDYLLWAREQLAGVKMMVEFRHRSWLDEDARAETLSFLEEHGMTLVVVDAPRLDSPTVIPTLAALTGPIAYVRLHGRNAVTWNRRGGGAAERFDYLYAREELAEWVEPLRELARGAEQAYAFFNNNNRSPAPPGGDRDWLAQAPTNAAMLRSLLDEAGVEAAGGIEATGRTEP